MFHVEHLIRTKKMLKTNEKSGMEFHANLVDIIEKKIYPAIVKVSGGKIESIIEVDEEADHYILPGFVDAHIHIESSMVSPLAFSRTAVRHGTVGVVSDPHEIANVLGIPGVDFMVSDAERTPLKILFGAPSCVPATSFESSGSVISSKDIRGLLQKEEIGYLSEMMNYPGVIFGDKEVLEKLSIAKELGVPVDGHAPGVRGRELETYANAGISTDHECFDEEEAREKIKLGMKILIREGSGAKNFQALIPLLKEFPDKIMFCSDDLHPDNLLEGHINLLVKRSLDLGYDLFDTLRAAGYNAMEHYGINVGMLRVGDPADFIVVDSLDNLQILSTVIDGIAVFDKNEVKIPDGRSTPVNKFNIHPVSENDIRVEYEGGLMKVIQAINGELITRVETLEPLVRDNLVVSDTERDVLKIVVVNRYEQAEPAAAFIKGFGLKYGALASSIAHDSHNIICVGTSDREITETINWVIKNKGGIAVHDGSEVYGLPLEIAGIMATTSVEEAATAYSELSEKAAHLGSELTAPYMTLAFMALLVIPDLKLSDKGLFDGTTFSFTPLFSDQ